jgi:hypothetical protein
MKCDPFAISLIIDLSSSYCNTTQRTASSCAKFSDIPGSCASILSRLDTGVLLAISTVACCSSDHSRPNLISEYRWALILARFVLSYLASFSLFPGLLILSTSGELIICTAGELLQCFSADLIVTLFTDSRHHIITCQTHIQCIVLLVSSISDVQSFISIPMSNKSCNQSRSAHSTHCESYVAQVLLPQLTAPPHPQMAA